MTIQPTYGSYYKPANENKRGKHKNEHDQNLEYT